MTSKPVALILAGPNGAGKTTVSSVFVGPGVEFVNADIIGADLRRDDPNRADADVIAGRILHALSVPSVRVGALRQRCWSGGHRERRSR